MVKINETKLWNITYTLKHGICSPITLKNIIIPILNTTKYLGVHFDKKLYWSHHIHCTKLKVNSRLRLLRQILHSKSKLTLHTKLKLYMLLLKLIWTYGIQILGSAKKSNLNKISQNKIFRLITNAPFYVTNQTLPNLKMKTIAQTASNYCNRYLNSLKNRLNNIIKDLTLIIPGNSPKNDLLSI